MSVLSCKFGTTANLDWKGYGLYCHQPPGGNPGFNLHCTDTGVQMLKNKFCIAVHVSAVFFKQHLVDIKGSAASSLFLGFISSPFYVVIIPNASHLCVPVQEKMEMLSLPLANERRPCVLVGRDNMALPASLISQIGYRCHPSLYTEGDPGEKVELVAGRTRPHSRVGQR